jgi:hypothetical protein
MTKREQEIKDKKGNRFAYDSDMGLSVVSKGKKEKSDTKEKEVKKDGAK